MSSLDIFQVVFDIWLIILNLMLGFLTFETLKKGDVILKRLWRLVYVCDALLITDFLYFLLEGSQNLTIRNIAIISETILSVLQMFILWRFLLITDAIIYEKKQHKAGWDLILSAVLTWIDIVLQVVNLFFGFFWYYDDNGYRVMNQWYALSFLVPTVILVIWTVKIFRGQKYFVKSLGNVYQFIFAFIMVGVFINLFLPQISSINMAIAICVSSLYLTYWRIVKLDHQRNEIERLKNTIDHS